ncbi:invasion associated locus B family protein [Skermanella pratensis]|uniref:invasion associated locus B family protein n=1 Tax=Skermanella pratensis TaxID=2233999 RepID=UPI00130175A9|nr:invasion associated locus B family protein [Skermanella pratensis]
MVPKIRSRFGAALLALAAFAAAVPADAAEEKRFDDWKLQCADRAPEGLPKCIITQNVVSSDTNLGLLSVAVYFRPGADTPSLGFNLAPQAVKEAGMVLQIDARPALEMPIQECNPNFCVVRATLRDQVLTMFRNGTRGVVAFRIPPDQRIAAQISFRGFTNAFKALEQRKAG